MQYSLRPAGDADREAMMAIGHEGLRPYVEALWGWNQEEQEAKFQEHFIPEDIQIIQQDHDDVGYIKVERHSDHMFLAGIYVGAGHRGQGIGAAVVTDLIESCRAEGTPLRLQVLRPNPAQKLYLRLGFKVVGETESHILMEAGKANP